MILVDTSVMLDVLNDDPRWEPWSNEQLVSAATDDRLAINDIIFAELAVGYGDLADIEAVMADWRLQLMPIPRAGLFYVGKAYHRYRRSGGPRTGVLSDFFIGAHALAEGWPLLTRDTGRVKTYFPSVTLISP